MMIDRMENAARYAFLGRRLSSALEFLRATDFSTTAPGRYELDGDQLYYLVQEYLPKPVSAGKAEAHRRYIDIQFVLRGEEFIGYADLSQLQAMEYLAEKDFLAVEGKMDLVRVPAGSFMLLFPNDAHMPGLSTGAEGVVRKVVVKAKVD